MEFPMRIVVATVVLLIAILIFLFMVAGWFGKQTGLVSWPYE